MIPRHPTPGANAPRKDGIAYYLGLCPLLFSQLLFFGCTANGSVASTSATAAACDASPAIGPPPPVQLYAGGKPVPFLKPYDVYKGPPAADDSAILAAEHTYSDADKAKLVFCARQIYSAIFLEHAFHYQRQEEMPATVYACATEPYESAALTLGSAGATRAAALAPASILYGPHELELPGGAEEGAANLGIVNVGFKPFIFEISGSWFSATMRDELAEESPGLSFDETLFHFPVRPLLDEPEETYLLSEARTVEDMQMSLVATPHEMVRVLEDLVRRPLTLSDADRLLSTPLLAPLYQRLMGEAQELEVRPLAPRHQQPRLLSLPGGAVPTSADAEDEAELVAEATIVIRPPSPAHR